MENYLERIEEAIQRTPEEKKKAKAIQKDFEECFGDRIYSKKFDYEVNVEDLKKIFDIANKHFFNGKLDKRNIDFSVSAGKPKEKGKYLIGETKDDKHMIIVYRYAKDNFFQIVNVVLHEMVHAYDNAYGPLSKIMEHRHVHNVYDKQYVNDYNAHGKYFKDWCNKINLFGFAVKEKYMIDDKRAMKKINEKERVTNSFFDEERKEDDEKYQRIKTIYDCLKNCEKEMVYRDAEHWYIGIS